MNKLPLLKFDVNAWLTGKVQLLSAAEKGIFIDLVARIWASNNSLKNDEFLHRLIRVEKGTLSEALQAFFELGIMEDKSGFLSVNFIDTQIEDYESYIEQQREFGAKGGRPKKGTEPGVFKERKKKKKKEKSTKKEIRNNKKDKKDIFPPYIPQNGGNGDGDSISQETLSINESPEWLEPVTEVTEGPVEATEPEVRPQRFSEIFLAMKSKVGELFHRPAGTQWDARELTILRRIVSVRPDCLSELSSIARLYNSGYKYCRHDIRTFLNNFATEYDRSINDKQRKAAGI